MVGPGMQTGNWKIENDSVQVEITVSFHIFNGRENIDKRQTFFFKEEELISINADYQFNFRN